MAFSVFVVTKVTVRERIRVTRSHSNLSYDERLSIHLHIDKRKQKEHACTNVSEEDDDSFAYGSASDSSSDDDDDQNFDDWNDSLFFGPESRIQSLFE
ncbi:hypothetical protein K435DRAFT_866888 [Dendrothele bispora CBS 962.96]|uniref:Uncharacterized protein n=1 Tax=Dendrothele bispora (strain CBS 962.96) TaxID=1314807 RepID=A0A4S8LFT9_DENBC|nr:hypothetical protein K435DRAFT_866888 [Dendrothele bispora CBS 962.96]